MFAIKETVPFEGGRHVRPGGVALKDTRVIETKFLDSLSRRGSLGAPRKLQLCSSTITSGIAILKVVTFKNSPLGRGPEWSSIPP
jgi:hypothetical protein